MAAASTKLPAAGYERLQLHVSKTWARLTRSLHHALDAVRDDKLAGDGDQRWPLYVSACEDVRRVRERLRRSMEPEAFRQIHICVLNGAPEQVTRHGLVYVPGRYVVPGGRFNEVYGWDSYFIAQGLLCDDRVGLAQSIAEVQLYQVKHYGTVLNCNRTYCLTRSHPPFLGRLVLDVFGATGDIDWLRRALPFVERYHAYWSTLPQFIPGMELSRYYALGDGPAPEVVQGELDANGRTHYERLCEWLRCEIESKPELAAFYDRSTHSLTPSAYKDDRTVRESGFDLTGRFGPCGLGIRDFAPVCLNTLLWRLEMDIAEMRRILGSSPAAIEHGTTEAANRDARMHRHFLHPGVRASRPALDALHSELGAAVSRMEGAEVEDKGASLTVHWRRVDEARLAELMSAIDRVVLTAGICRRAGKSIVEFRPDIAWNKGSALRHFMQLCGIGPRHTVYIGDDCTDEDAFDVLTGAGITVRVGEEAIETKAVYSATDTPDVLALIRNLIDRGDR